MEQIENNMQFQTRDTDDSYFNSFPPGIRFCPKDEELIKAYLFKKVNNLPLPRNKIKEVNFYNLHPEELTRLYENHRESEWYFFSSRDKKYPNGKRPRRDAANGYWKQTGTHKKIPKENPMGCKKTFDFFEGKHTEGYRSAWSMHEYTIDETHISNPNKRNKDDMKLDDWVLCKLYNKTKLRKDKHDIDNEKSVNVIDDNTAMESSTFPLPSNQCSKSTTNESIESLADTNHFLPSPSSMNVSSNGVNTETMNEGVNKESMANEAVNAETECMAAGVLDYWFNIADDFDPSKFIFANDGDDDIWEFKKLD